MMNFILIDHHGSFVTLQRRSEVVLVFSNQFSLDVKHLIVVGLYIFILLQLLFDPGCLLLSVLFEAVNPLNIGSRELVDPLLAVITDIFLVGSERPSLHISEEISPLSDRQFSLNFI